MGWLSTQLLLQDFFESTVSHISGISSQFEGKNVDWTKSCSSFRWVNFPVKLTGFLAPFPGGSINLKPYLLLGIGSSTTWVAPSSMFGTTTGVGAACEPEKQKSPKNREGHESPRMPC